MSLTPTQLEELQTIVIELGEEFPNNSDALWNAAIRLQKADLGPITGSGGQAAFDAAVADMKTCQEEVQNYQGRQGSLNSGFDVATLQVVPVGNPAPSGNVGEIQYISSAPNTYSATDQILITPAGPNSVQIDEVGTTVFRTVPAASGGVEVNNLSTGAGFERVLTTSDIMGAADLQAVTTAGFSTTVGISIDTGAPFVINDATDTDGVLFTVSAAATVRGGLGIGFLGTAGITEYALGDVSAFSLTLQEKAAAQSAVATLGELWVRSDTPNVLMFTDDAGTDFVLNTTANPGGVDTNIQYNDSGSFGGSANFTWTEVEASRQLAIAAGSTTSGYMIDVDLGNSTATDGIIFRNPANNPYNFLRVTDQNDANGFTFEMDHTLSSPNHELIINSDSSGQLMVFRNDAEIFIGSGTANAPLLVDAPDSAVRIQDSASLFIESKAAAIADESNYGQLYVLDADNELYYKFNGQTAVNLSSGVLPVSSTEGILLAGDGSGGWREAFGVVMEATAAPPAAGEGYVRLSGTSTVVARQPMIFANTNNSVSTFYYIETENDPDGFYLQVSGSANPNTHTWGFDRNVGGQTEFFQLTSNFEVRILDDGIFRIQEKAAAGSDVTTYGQIWVNSADTRLTYTDEGGTDNELAYSSELPANPVDVSGTPVDNQLAIWVDANTIQGDANITWDTTELRITGVIRLAERANSLADVSGFGQIWVSNSGNPNELFYTDESGNDINLITSLWENGTEQARAVTLGLDVRDTLKVGSLGSTSGVLKLGEQANADADEAGYGQFWVQDDAPNDPRFTDDAGNDFWLGLAPGRTTLNSSVNFNNTDERAANRILYYGDGSNNTITLEDSGSTANWPVGTIVQLIAPGSGNQTLTEGSGTTLFLQDGTDTVGGGTVSQGAGSIFRASTTDYIYIGDGFTT